MIFVVAFDRNTGKLVVYERYADSNRSVAEASYRTQLARAMSQTFESLEVNMFEADSEETFRVTHSRYFLTSAQMMDDLKEQLRKTLPK